MAEDGELFDSWEEQEDNGILDRRLDEMKVKVPPKTAVASVLSAGLQEDSDRTEFQPQVRILKRAASPKTTTPSSNSSQGGKPMKTLEQREAEYAQARLRIFGSMEEDASNDGDSQESQDKSAAFAQKFEAAPSQNAVCRQPKGPDGSHGFSLER